MDITQIVEDAKAHLLEHGDHIPTLFVEFKGKQLNMIVFANLPEVGLPRQKQFFALGRKIGMENKGREVECLYFITEAWGVTYHEGDKREYPRIADDPNRRELLTIQVLDASTRTIKQEMYHTEMIRYEGKFLDLAPMDAPDECHNKLLISFLAGLVSTKLSDREFAKIVGKFM